MPVYQSESLSVIKKRAMELSKGDGPGRGFAQHVNRRADGSYYISDWFDSDSTVASYENGREKWSK